VDVQGVSFKHEDESDVNAVDHVRVVEVHDADAVL
jgi:hypothetical protein